MYCQKVEQFGSVYIECKYCGRFEEQSALCSDLKNLGWVSLKTEVHLTYGYTSSYFKAVVTTPGK